MLVQGRTPTTEGEWGMKRGIVSLIALGIVGFTVAGCSSSLSADELETQVSNSYKTQTGTGIESITCEDAETDVGSPISCEATNADGIKVAIDGEVTSYDSDSQVADFTWEAKPIAGSGS